jgi:hypothetical protein
MAERLKLVEIEWVDSNRFASGWEYIADLDRLEPTRCRSIGFLFKDTPEYKVLVQTMAVDQVLGGVTIPTRAILKLRRIALK